MLWAVHFLIRWVPTPTDLLLVKWKPGTEVLPGKDGRARGSHLCGLQFAFRGSGSFQSHLKFLTKNLASKPVHTHPFEEPPMLAQYGNQRTKRSGPPKGVRRTGAVGLSPWNMLKLQLLAQPHAGFVDLCSIFALSVSDLVSLLLPVPLSPNKHPEDLI